ncbi:hypothetical protein L810_4188 [Burkholderia sp. AU4i]|nr:hypothetical protein L810_4188 [Burkholderia sp. AU4i]
MHRRSPCRCTFCSRRPRPRARRRRRPGAASGARAIIGAQKSSGVKSFVQITQDLKPYMGQ